MNLGHEVVALDNFSRGKKDSEFEELCRSIHFLEADLTRPFPEISGEFDGVFHLAGVVGVEDVLKDPSLVFERNVKILFETFSWLRKTKVHSFLYASSSEVYGWGHDIFDLPVPTPEDVPLLVPPRQNFRGGYALSKMNGEVLTEMVCSEQNVPFSIVRLHNVYGPRMGYSHVIPQLWKKIRESDGKLSLKNPSNTRAFCFVDDAVFQMYQSIQHPINDVMNVGNEREEVSVSELASRIAVILDTNLEVEPVDDVRDPFKRRCPDMSKRLSSFGELSLISLDEGLKRSLDWYEKTHHHS